MRDRILETALRLCKTYGVKSITMQDIAKECGISKKTVYEHFSDKNELIDEVTNFMTGTYCNQLADCQDAGRDAIEELVLSIGHTERMARSTNPVLLFELEKYHPSAWKKVKNFKDEMVAAIIRSNLERGIREGLYRNNLRADIMVYLRLMQMDALFNPVQFPAAQFEMHDVMYQITVHYINGIATPEGQALLEQYLPSSITA
ncbi:TetR/AcrR family transcriptional regulator [Chitinophaga deserti]|uniref:TetR/AcrR family transcriptional regulator n=1 Tax=Chitinophaga deserti TaxID=2164099 RepID=UPI000D6C803E|nr:TetR/AcrR family transcriptional regulator [Chitinophaga deserti]